MKPDLAEHSVLSLPKLKSWFFKLARSPAFDPLLSDSNAASTRDEYQQARRADSLQYSVDDNVSVLLRPSVGNLSASSNITIALRFTPTHSPTNKPILSRKISTLVLPDNSHPATYRAPATQTMASITPYYVYGLPSAPARLPVHVAIPPHHLAGPVSSFQFGLAFRLLLCIPILFYYILPLVYRKRRLERKRQGLSERVVSMIIANLQ